MITREEAKDLMSNRHKHINKSSLDVVDDIYDSLGTCIECKKYSSCIIPKLKHRYERANTFYCADFIKDKK